MASSDASLIVAAFDFGTTYSGYAFSFRDDPMKVQTNQNWIAGSEKLISLKTPTCVLLDPKGQFAAFGYEAENKYATLSEDEEHHGWRLFRRFKMALHNNETLTKHSTVEDMEGKTMTAIPIFSMAIGFLRDHLLESIAKQAVGVEETDIQYVLTVPAIWSDDAKHFMREAAIKAGFDTKRLKIALEPEAASVWCEKVSSEAKIALAGEGTRFMVVDLGGGTADISVHEKICDGKLKEIHKASGGPWGGIYVDENYINALKEIFGAGAVESLKDVNMSDYFDILREFETKKRSFKSNMTDKLTIRISAALRKASKEKTGQKLNDRLSNLDTDDVELRGKDKLRFSPSSVQKWFDGPVNALIKHLKSILSDTKMKMLNTVLLVGGFGESEYVRERIQREFPNKRLVVPTEAGLVVLKGAVRFGHAPGIIASRIMKYTYGTRIFRQFDETKHPLSKKKIVNGVWKTKDCFNVFVKAGDEVEVDHQVTRVQKPNSVAATIPIFYTTDTSPTFTTELGCRQIGVMKVYHSKDQPISEQREKITFVFGDTELCIKGISTGTGKESCMTFSSFE